MTNYNFSPEFDEKLKQLKREKDAKEEYDYRGAFLSGVKPDEYGNLPAFSPEGKWLLNPNSDKAWESAYEKVTGRSPVGLYKGYTEVPENTKQLMRETQPTSWETTVLNDEQEKEFSGWMQKIEQQRLDRNKPQVDIAGTLANMPNLPRVDAFNTSPMKSTGELPRDLKFQTQAPVGQVPKWMDREIRNASFRQAVDKMVKGGKYIEMGGHQMLQTFSPDEIKEMATNRSIVQDKPVTLRERVESMVENAGQTIAMFVPDLLQTMGIVGDIALNVSPNNPYTIQNLSNPENRIFENLFDDTVLSMREGIKNHFNVDPTVKGWEQDVSSAMASAVGFAIGGGIGGVLKVPTYLSTGILSLTQATQSFNEALDETGDYTTAVGAFNMMVPFALTEIAPMEKFFDLLKSAKASPFSVGKLLSAMMNLGGTDAIQEAIQQVGSNWTAQTLYDATRGIFEDVPKSAGLGFFVGAFMGTMANLIKTKSEDENLSDADRIKLDQAFDIVNKFFEDTALERVLGEADAILPPDAGVVVYEPVDQEKEAEEYIFDEDFYTKEDIEALSMLGSSPLPVLSKKLEKLAGSKKTQEEILAEIEQIDGSLKKEGYSFGGIQEGKKGVTVYFKDAEQNGVGITMKSTKQFDKAFKEYRNQQAYRSVGSDIQSALKDAGINSPLTQILDMLETRYPDPSQIDVNQATSEIADILGKEAVQQLAPITQDEKNSLIKVIHFSASDENGIVLDPQRFGENEKTSNDVRASKMPRVFFYSDPKIVEHQLKVKNLYEGEVSGKVYNIDKDPEGWFRSRGATYLTENEDGSMKENKTSGGGDVDFHAGLKNLRKAGYDFAYYDAQGVPMIVGFKKYTLPRSPILKTNITSATTEDGRKELKKLSQSFADKFNSGATNAEMDREATIIQNTAINEVDKRVRHSEANSRVVGTGSGVGIFGDSVEPTVRVDVQTPIDNIPQTLLELVDASESMGQEAVHTYYEGQKPKGVKYGTVLPDGSTWQPMIKVMIPRNITAEQMRELSQAFERSGFAGVSINSELGEATIYNLGKDTNGFFKSAREIGGVLGKTESFAEAEVYLGDIKLWAIGKKGAWGTTATYKEAKSKLFSPTRKSKEEVVRSIREDFNKGVFTGRDRNGNPVDITKVKPSLQDRFNGAWQGMVEDSQRRLYGTYWGTKLHDITSIVGIGSLFVYDTAIVLADKIIRGGVKFAEAFAEHVKKYPLAKQLETKIRFQTEKYIKEITQKDWADFDDKKINSVYKAINKALQTPSKIDNYIPTEQGVLIVLGDPHRNDQGITWARRNTLEGRRSIWATNLGKSSFMMGQAIKGFEHVVFAQQMDAFSGMRGNANFWKDAWKVLSKDFGEDQLRLMFKQAYDMVVESVNKAESEGKLFSELKRQNNNLTNADVLKELTAPEFKSIITNGFPKANKWRSDNFLNTSHNQRTLYPVMKEVLKMAKAYAKANGMDFNKYTQDNFIRHFLHNEAVDLQGRIIGVAKMTGREVDRKKQDPAHSFYEVEISGESYQELTVPLHIKTLLDPNITTLKESERRGGAMWAKMNQFGLPVKAEGNPMIQALIDISKGDKDAMQRVLDLKGIPSDFEGEGTPVWETDAWKQRIEELRQKALKKVAPKAGNKLFNLPLGEVKSLADNYYEEAFGKPRPEFNGTTVLDEARAKKIAKAYEEMENNPSDPEVKEAYEKMVEETMNQYRVLEQAGYTIEINNSEPYANSEEMIEDLRVNKRIKIFSTESGFGETEITDQQRQENPLLRDSGVKDVNGKPLLNNDVFRAVHDFFGHAELGNSFGAKGEENAWNVHARMFSPVARRAMTTETRGQNSYVNFSGVNDNVKALREKAKELRQQGKTEEAQKITEQIYTEMKFADQKIGLLPEEFSAIDENDKGNREPRNKDGYTKKDLELLNMLGAGSLFYGAIKMAGKIFKWAGGSFNKFGKAMVDYFGKQIRKILPDIFNFFKRAPKTTTTAVGAQNQPEPKKKKAPRMLEGKEKGSRGYSYENLHPTVKRNLNQIVNEVNAMLQKQKRGRITNEQSRNYAIKYAGTLTDADLLDIKKGTLDRAEKVLGARIYAEQKLAEALEEMKGLKAMGVDLNQATEFAKKLGDAMKMWVNVRAMISEAGRVVQATTGAMDQELIDGLKTMLKAVAPNTPLANDMLAELEESSNTQGRFWFIYYNFILSNFFTDMANIVGNTAHLTYEFVTKAIANPTGAGSMLRGMKRGLTKALPEIIEVINGEKEAESKYNERKQTYRFIPETTLGKVLNGLLPTTRLSIEDAIFRNVAKEMEKWRIANRVAKEKGGVRERVVQQIEDLMEMPPEKFTAEQEELQQAISYLDDYGKYITFQRQLGIVGRGAQALFGWWPLRPVVPFVRTPANIFKTGFDNSPVGFIKYFKDKNNNDISDYEKANTLRRAVAGSLFLGGLASMVSAGLMRITGAGGDDPEENEINTRLGIKPYHIYYKNPITGDWEGFSYQNINPVNVPLAMMGGWYDDMRYNSRYDRDDKDWFQKFTIAVFTTFSAMQDQSFLSGVGAFQREMDFKSGDYLWKMGANMVIPNILGMPKDISQMLSGEKPVYQVDNIFDAWVNKMRLGTEENLLPRIDVFGDQKMSTYERFPVPISRIKTEEEAPVERFIADNQLDLKEVGKKKIDDREMTDEEYVFYKRAVGKYYYEGIKDYVDYIKNAGLKPTKEEMQEAVDEAYDYAKKDANYDLLDYLEQNK